MDSYNLAARKFVNRDFDGAVQSVDPVLQVGIPDLRVKAWVLYTTIAEFAFNTSKWSRESKLRKQVCQSVESGSFWTKLNQAFITDPQQLRPGLVLAALQMMAKHTKEQRLTMKAIEAYMVEVHPSGLPEVEYNAYRALVEVFVLDVLCDDACAEFDYAKEIVMNSTELLGSKRAHLSLEVERREADFQESGRRRQQEERIRQLELEKQEAIRVSEAIAISNSELSVPDNPEPTPSDLPVSSRAPKGVLPQDTSRTNLIQLWKQWLSEKIRSQGLYNALILAFVVVTVVSNRKIRSIARTGAAWLAAALTQTVRMGLTVTYL